MKSRFLRIVFVCFCLASVAGLNSRAQGKPPGGPPPGGPPPGGPSSGAHGPGSQDGSDGSPPAASASMGTNGTTHSGLQIGPEGRWWDDKPVERSIGLRKDQKQRMDRIFDANKPAIVASYKAFLSEQSKLDALNKDPQLDKARLFAAIDAVSQARASLQKANSQMLLDIRKELDPDQIDKLEKLQ